MIHTDVGTSPTIRSTVRTTGEGAAAGRLGGFRACDRAERDPLGAAAAAAGDVPAATAPASVREARRGAPSVLALARSPRVRAFRWAGARRWAR